MKSRGNLRMMGAILIVFQSIACSIMGNIIAQVPTPTKVIFGVEQTPSATPQMGASVQHWTGTIQTTTSADYGAAGTCTDEQWNSSLALTVQPDGMVSGSGEAHIMAGPKCSGPGAASQKTDATKATFDVSGTFGGGTFSLTFNETAIDGSTAGLFNYALLLGGQLTFPITGTSSAGGTVNVARDVVGGGATANAQHVVALECGDC